MLVPTPLRIFLSCLLSVGFGDALCIQESPNLYQFVRSNEAITIDGKLGRFWESVPRRQLLPIEAGIPSADGGELRMALRGKDLCFAVRCPEHGGKVLARSIGRNPIWEKDSYDSPEVEDRIALHLRYKTGSGNGRTFSLSINPWGAFRLEEEGEVVVGRVLPVAAMVDPEGWTAEAAFPLTILGVDSSQDGFDIAVRVERIRSRRPLAPEFRWAWPSAEGEQKLRLQVPTTPSRIEPVKFEPPLLGNPETPLIAGRVSPVPSPEPVWDSPEWQNVPVISLLRNEPHARAPRYPTQVKFVHDGRILALLFRASEPEPLVADHGGRDSAVSQDDHLAVYLATSGSAFLEILINPVGAIRDSLAKGPHITRPSSAWNEEIRVRTDIDYGAWTARIDIPLDKCAAALGEVGVPEQWRMLLARRRAPRAGEADETSSIPQTGSATFYGPVRYRRMVLGNEHPSLLKSRDQTPSEEGGLAGQLSRLESDVWSSEYRRYHEVRRMLDKHGRRRVEEAVWKEHQDWKEVNNREEWEKFREIRFRALQQAVGRIPGERPDLDLRVTGRFRGDGYLRENLVYQSRPGFYAAANLYLPLDPSPPLPAIIIQHSHHYPRTQGELQDMGMLWARTGCAVLVVERPGFGERVETTPWYRQSYASRFIFNKQLGLIGETHIGWTAWDLIRAIDLLYQRPEIDRQKIILIGSVAGGGQGAALAAALDPRVSAVVPYNYDQGHIDMDEDLVGKVSRQFLPWFVTAAIAPRKLIRAFEFGWEGAEEPDYPRVWDSGWLRSQKVWSFYDALGNLARAHAYGLIRLSMERVSHCFSVGPQQRLGLYPHLKRWFNIPYPSAADLEILPDSGLTVNEMREAALRQEAQRRRSDSELLCITPEVSMRLSRRPLHNLAREIALAQLNTARDRRQLMGSEEATSSLQSELRQLLGDIEPNRSPAANLFWSRSLDDIRVEALALKVEDGIEVPLLVIRPPSGRRTPVVVAVGDGGKDRILKNRHRELERLIQAGLALCLPDVRGTGETTPEFNRGDHGAQGVLAEREFSLGNTLLGLRLKDLRTVLAYLRSRSDLDLQRIALWGDAFVPSNPEPLFLDELQYESGPQIQHQAEPLGAHLALLGALYEPDVCAIAAQRGLAGYLSVLEDRFAYLPLDAMVPGILKSGDIADIAAALAPRPLLLSDLVNGRNQTVGPQRAAEVLRIARHAYDNSRAKQQLVIGPSEEIDAIEWLIEKLVAY